MHIDTALVADSPAFAAANGLTFTAHASAPEFGGALFEFLQDRSVTPRFSSIDGPIVDVGNIEGSVGGSQTRQSKGWTVTTSYSSSARREYGYLAMQLERAVPQLVLDAKANGSSIPMPIGGGQTLSLEGDFDSHFTLYCPKGYERDALYIFTPDLMALLIDETGDFDVEVVDDMLYVYSPKPLDLEDAATWQRLARISEVVGAKALSQTDYYSDDRVGDRMTNVVAEDGRRLRMGFFGNGGVLLAAGLILTAVVVVFAVVLGLLFL